jgi:hypothetical protein
MKVARDTSVSALTMPDYLGLHNGDQFNSEMKCSSNGRFMESSRYISKKEAKELMKQDRVKYQDDMAKVAFAEDSLPKGRRGPFSIAVRIEFSSSSV